MVLASMLQRDIEILHGKGSVIFANPAPNNSAEIGGRVIEELLSGPIVEQRD